MKMIHTLLAYYSAFMASALILWSLFISSKPVWFILALLILPISIYFWILASGKRPPLPHNQESSPIATSGERKMLGLLLTIALFIGTSSIILYIALVGSKPQKSITDSQAPIEQSLKKVQSDINTLKKTATSLEKIDTRLTLIESTLLRLENKDENKLLDEALQGVFGTSTNASTAATPGPTTRPSSTPVKNTD